MSTKTLKIYIEPASLPLTQQLLDYVENINDVNVSSIIIFERLNINIENVQNGRTAFFHGVNAGLSLKLDNISKFILGKKDHKIEIHTNIYRETDILVPLLKRIIPGIAFSDIKLHLYDDGLGTMLQRQEMSKIDGSVLHKTMQQRAHLLQKIFTSNKPLNTWPWHFIDHYIWHYITNVEYHFIQPAETHKMQNAFFTGLKKFISPMTFERADADSSYSKEIWQRLFTLPESTKNTLASLANSSEAMLFLTTYHPNEQAQEAHHQATLRKISDLKAAGKFPPANQIVYKGHPHNSRLNSELCDAIGEGITFIPENIPLEYLQVAGLLPPNIAGCLSTAFFSLRSKNVKFVIFNDNEKSEQNQRFVDIINAYKCFDTNKITYLDD